MICNSYDKKTYKKEDDVVLSFFDKLDIKRNNINYLEIGSGLCRFPLLIKSKYKNFEIRCLEKNENLVNLGIKNGLGVVRGDVAKLDFPDHEFDFIHCSHVIEHLDCGHIAEALDEMLRVLRSGGHLIIRSPLAHPGFYFDLDHVRPYPPESILNYFNNQQQQRVGQWNILEVNRWYRKEACSIFNSSSRFINLINFISKVSWLVFNFPKTKPNGYILILKKI